MRAVGIILADGKNERLGNLTSQRASSAMPVGSCYRAIDFSLSCMSNSGVNKVAVITQYNSRSLHDHLSSAKWWDLGRKHGGLFIFSPFLSSGSSNWFRGTADSIYQNMTFLQRSNEPYVVISSGESVFKMDFNEIINHHIRKDAEITVAYQDMAGRSDVDVHDFDVIEMDESGRLTNLEEKPIEPLATTASLGVYVISRTLLIKLLETIVPESRYDLVKDIIIRFRKKLRIYAYEYKGYWSSVNSVGSYYNINMDFLRKEVRDALILNPPYIMTKPKDEPSAKYNHGAVVRNSLVGSGSILNGYAESSVIYRKVFAGDNSTVVGSIIMESCYLGNNCVIENAILDKEVIVSDGKVVRGEPGKPLIITKSMVV